jgi:small subunit ribosomal protein S6
MTVSNPTYDLVVLLDPDAEEPSRAKIIAARASAIDAGGEVVRHDTWGNRALSYPIRRRTSAEYHLLQFRAASPELLSRLNRSLRITDGILRFRIIKLKPGVPEPPDMAGSGTVAGSAATDSEGSASPPAGAASASSGGSQASTSHAASSGGRPASSGGDQVNSGGDAASSGGDQVNSGGGPASSGGDAASGGAAGAPEPGAADAAEGTERVQAGGT